MERYLPALEELSKSSLELLLLIIISSEKSLTIFVSIEDPGLNAYSGGMIAAPLFAEIAESSLNYLGYIEDE